MLGRPFKWTDQNHERARLMWAEGRSLSEIAAALGIHKGAISGYSGRNRDAFPHRVSAVATAAKLDVPKQIQKPKSQWTQERILKAATLYARNETIASMAKSMGVSTAAMGDVVKRYPQHFPERVRPNSGASAKTSALFRRADREAKASERAQRGFDSSMFAIPDTSPVRFIDLTAHQCKFPISAADGPSNADMPCCGMRISLGSYCSHHAAIARGDGTRGERVALDGIGGRKL
ncbi:GcrA family cell cycle regulator [Rhizobium sp. RCAM05973]|uniref:GcrA family cell cycle regulator n=1 Tax=Rhizobium sp. RCAM05973 TaxID=2994066 RepID=UPI0022EBD520|nr:GcrA family cell cycle regulator [Rhizobium sp. RCAM05973]